MRANVSNRLMSKADLTAAGVINDVFPEVRLSAFKYRSTDWKLEALVFLNTEDSLQVFHSSLSF